MKVLNFGSLNLDYVYDVDHFVLPGETLDTLGRSVKCGGKGLNQSVALARAGADVCHAGCIGEGGEPLKALLEENGVDTASLRKVEGMQGHTVIQVNPAGENCILLYGGSNRCITPAYIDEVMEGFEKGDVLLLQNEISGNGYAIEKGHEKGMTVVLNPSPYDSRLDECDYSKVDIFMVNEVEGRLMAGCDSEDPAVIRECLKKAYPNAAFVLTLGEAGSCYFKGSEEYFQPIYSVKAVDTTAAGDTFCGYFLSSMAQGLSIPECLRHASAASAISVSRSGASPSIPVREEVEAFLKEH